VTGVCDTTTWTALVEASWQLGDRSLFLRSPHLRGDDVAELQRRLAQLGFDCGRVDGIFGPDTLRALTELQTNSGLVSDGICGPTTVAAIVRLCRQSGAGPGVAAVREMETLRDAIGVFATTKIVVGQLGGLSVLSSQIVHGLRRLGAHVIGVDEPDQGTQAVTANRYDADVYVGIEAEIDAVSSIAYYATTGFASAGGRHLAHLIADTLGSLGWQPVPTTVGMRLPILRETRMPAVMCTLGPVRTVVDSAPALAEAITTAVAAWIREPLR
jgi:N-acetylmuramoyl-L-alanine amidase